MKKPAPDKLSSFIFAEMAKGLAPQLLYHGIGHTRDDVLPAARYLAERCDITDEDLLLLETAALLHDTGYLYRYEENEPLAAELARELLPDYSYNETQIKVVAELILKTTMPQKPITLLEEILCDADLDSLGRDDFMVTSNRLRRELSAYGHNFTQQKWLEKQLAFLEGHRYFSAAARAHRDEGKNNNIATVRGALNKLKQKTD